MQSPPLTEAGFRVYATGFYLMSSIYLLGVFLAGYLTAHAWSWRLVLISAGIGAISYDFRMSNAPKAGTAIAAVSQLCAVVAGANLLDLW